MSITTDLAIDASGNIRRAVGATTSVYTVLELHAFLQDLADDAAAAGDDAVSILTGNPSRLDGPRDAAVASRLNLLPTYNIDDAVSQFLRFGSIRQAGGDTLYSGLKTIGSIVPASPMYVVQAGAKLAKWWGDGHIQVLIKVRNAGSLIDSGLVRVFSRKYGQTYSDFEVDLSAGGETAAAVPTSLDAAVVLSEVDAAALSSRVTITVGDTTQDLGNGNGPKLYRGTIALSGGCTVQEAYQYLQYITREDSSATIDGTPGWRYRALRPAYAPNSAAPFGSFAGGRWFVAQGWWLTGVLPAEAQAYQLTADDGTTQSPPNTVGITVGNLVVGDRVLVARSSGGAIVANEFSTTSSLAPGATAVPVTPSIGPDRPSSGVIRIGGRRYPYGSRTASQFNLSTPLAEAYPSGSTLFVPYLDRVAASTSESVSFVFSAPFTALARVRNGSGATPIVPFETTLSVGAGGASANAVRTSDV